MQYTDRIQKAIALAIKVHELDQKQKRRGRDVPYITHPLAVALILARARAAEDVVIAGVLHDVVEDSLPEKKITGEYIEEHFGKRVREMVMAVTEPDQTIPWLERKKEALERIPSMDQETILLKSADLIHNSQDLIEQFESKGREVFDDFHATPDMQIERYEKVFKALKTAWPENPLARELDEIIVKLREIY